MKKYLFKRILISLATLFVILLVLFFMMELMPGSPFNDEKLTEAQLALLYTKYGLDKPLFVRFFIYLKNMLTGDFGVSYAINKNYPVALMVKERLGLSIKIGGLAVVFGIIFGFILGTIAALKHNSWIDTLCSSIAVFGVSIPSYVFALVLCYFVAFKLKLFPILYTAKKPLASIVLPALALSFSPTASIARFVRSEMLDVLNSDYILLVKAKGVKDYKMIFSHVLRNSMIPIITVIGPIMVGLLTGSSVVEKVFGIPGVGLLLINGIQYNDYNVTISCAFVYSLMYVVVMIIIDILYGIIDPRIRVTKEGAK